MAPLMIPKQRTHLGTSMPLAGAVHHITVIPPRPPQARKIGDSVKSVTVTDFDFSVDFSVVKFNVQNQ
jgi:hypothetical protein